MVGEILGPLLKMIGYDYKNKRAKDKELLTKFLETLPSDSASINMLKDTDMGEPIFSEHFGPLNSIVELWERPDKIFQVNKLEKLKKEFIKSLKQFLIEYSKRSAGQSGGFISIGMRDYEDRAEMIEYRDRLNELATKAYENYCNFVSTARSEI